MSEPNSSPTTKPKKPQNVFKETLNLPKTKFPMRANLVQNEPNSVKRWRQANLYTRLREVRATDANAKKWSFHDGPPYANGSIHLGHLLNKVLKDFVVRSRSMLGFDVPYVPGWDCHGLPIEHKVMAELVAKGKMAKLNTLEDDVRRMAVRRECRKSAEKFIKLQRGQMERLLTIADYDNPYLTMAPEYEAGVLEVFSFMVRNKLVYRALKPVHWSIENQTALAEAELEYYDRDDTSIYVHFDLEDNIRLARAFKLNPDHCTAASVMIWTTTPWTLPANLAVAVHPRSVYALVNLQGRLTILARELVAKVAEICGIPDLAATEILAECPGEALVGLAYQHPFCERRSKIVAAEYVTLEDGTGLVHTAPGHGVDDYQTGLRTGLEIYCPVQADGTFDRTVPEWLQGKLIWDANDLVVEKLKSTHHLAFAQKFKHSYPHDWRGKTPVIFRATEQWFIDVNKPFGSTHQSLRERALELTATKVEFHPEWGRNRMRGMLESRPDWCLSRQRAWGLPIPVFFNTANQQEYLATERSVLAVAENVRKHGSDYWFTSEPAALLEGYDPADDREAPAWFQEGFNNSAADLSKIPLTKAHDIFDVWFESGSSWNPVMRGRDLGYPVELYLEGSDQHRGWFQLSLLCGLGATGQAPFKSILTHGFIVDAAGGKMSKSIGNTIEVEALLKKYGADVARWWVAGQNFDNDIKAGFELFDVAGESYRKIRNTLRFLLSNLFDYDPAEQPANRSTLPPTSLEAWVLREYQVLATTVLKAYQNYDFKEAQKALYTFCNETLSAVFCAAVKDRLYCDPAAGPRRRRTQYAMWHLLEGLTRLLAPLLPHTADETYRALHNAEDKSDPTCVHLETFIDGFPEVRVDPAWPSIMAARERGLQDLETARTAGIIDNPLDAEVILRDENGTLQEIAASAEEFPNDLADLLGVSRVQFTTTATAARVISLQNEPRCARSWKRDHTVRIRRNGALLSDRDAEALGYGS